MAGNVSEVVRPMTWRCVGLVAAVGRGYAGYPGPTLLTAITSVFRVDTAVVALRVESCSDSYRIILR